MRWIPFAILVYAWVVLQTTVGRLFVVSVGGIDRIGPDLLAVVAVFLALRAANHYEVLIAAWSLGLALDLTAGSAFGNPALGPMAISYCVAAWVVFRLRDAVFSEQWLTQMILAFIFCLVAHSLWIISQSVLTWSWSAGGRMMVQALGLAVYTGLLMPLFMRPLGRLTGFLMHPPARRGHRSRSGLRSQ